MWFLSVVEGPQVLENPTFFLVCARGRWDFFEFEYLVLLSNKVESDVLFCCNNLYLQKNIL